MTYPTVIVNGVSVRVDEKDRYSLNDLHAAAAKVFGICVVNFFTLKICFW